MAFYIHIESHTNRGPGILAHMDVCPQLALPMRSCMQVRSASRSHLWLHEQCEVRTPRIVVGHLLIVEPHSVARHGWLRLSEEVQLETDESDQATKPEFSHRNLESDSA